MCALTNQRSLSPYLMLARSMYASWAAMITTHPVDAIQWMPSTPCRIVQDSYRVILYNAQQQGLFEVQYPILWPPSIGQASIATWWESVLPASQLRTAGAPDMRMLRPMWSGTYDTVINDLHTRVCALQHWLCSSKHVAAQLSRFGQ